MIDITHWSKRIVIFINVLQFILQRVQWFGNLIESLLSERSWFSYRFVFYSKIFIQNDFSFAVQSGLIKFGFPKLSCECSYCVVKNSIENHFYYKSFNFCILNQTLKIIMFKLQKVEEIDFRESQKLFN